jgi:3-phenylpropionate/cinnamic acid dioxygenase small subunit
MKGRPQMMETIRATIAVFLLVLLSGMFCPYSQAEDYTASAVSDPDRSQIMDLIQRYSHTVDSRDVDGFVSLFIEDCRWAAMLSKNPFVLDSRIKLRQYLVERLKYFADRNIQTRHLQTNTLLTRISDDRVSGITYLTLICQVKGEQTPRLVTTGLYKDEFVKTEVGWKFAVREGYLDQEGLPAIEPKD